MKVLYLTYPDYIYSSGIVWNQVFTLLNTMCRQNPQLQIELVCFVPFPEWMRRGNRHALIRDYLDKKITLKVYPAFLKRSWILPLFPLFWLATVPFVWNAIRRFEPQILHTRGLSAGLIAHLAGGAHPWILDMRGLFPEEGAHLGFWPEGGLAFRLWKKIESALIKNANAVNFVSEKMEAQFLKREAGTKGHVIPPGVSTDLFQPAGEGEPEKSAPYRLVYSGSLEWGKLADLQKLFRAVAQVKPGAQICFLFPHHLRKTPRDHAFELQRHFNPGEFVIEHAWPQEVPAKLQQAHAGILVRDNSVVNKVAWPTKCLEYWASGLPILTNGGVPAVDDIIKKENLGAILTLDQQEEDQSRLIDFFSQEKKMRERCRRFAEENLSMGKTASSYLKLYQKLAS